MSAVIAAPELIEAAATDLASISETLNAAHMTAAASTTQLLAAAGDQVSAGIAHLFSQHAADYQALAGKAAAFQEQFVQRVNAGAGAYASAEAANASLMRPLNASAASQSPVLFLESLPVVGQLFEGLFAILGISVLVGFFVAIFFLAQLGSLLAQYGL